MKFLECGILNFSTQYMDILIYQYIILFISQHFGSFPTLVKSHIKNIWQLNLCIVCYTYQLTKKTIVTKYINITTWQVIYVKNAILSSVSMLSHGYTSKKRNSLSQQTHSG
jgi:hypothetical protein